ncbi:hypothetical protein QTJ16_004036 [Diplocarpon rosae]|uniref:DUF125-domain-containing protein n=1 Tax=Diplocarpon rosae TaxID=946125 RepID=A0AAD9T083_9HELO|nr:hypothetical protein QTJ16_004036 [Diplocarpon rosae]
MPNHQTSIKLVQELRKLNFVNKKQPILQVTGCCLAVRKTERQGRVVVNKATNLSILTGIALPEHTIHRKIVRRTRPERKPSPVRAMSIVGIKNLFFHQTAATVPVRSRANYGTTASGDGSQQPFLGQSDLSRSYEALEPSISINSETDIESQQSTDSRIEKTNKKNGFRIDARVISDATIGLSDGLTVPFALTAGLSALGNTNVVIYGGFAELMAGAISMGLGGYLGAKSEAASYHAQRAETEMLVATNPQAVIKDITEVFQPFALPTATLKDLTQHLGNSPHLVDFVMQFQYCEEEPASSRALTSAMTIALSYFLGGLLPLIPYFFVGKSQVYEGLYISIGVMVVALFLFGYVKTCAVVGWAGGKNIRTGCWGGLQMVVVGSAAAGCAMGLVHLFNRDEASVSLT